MSRLVVPLRRIQVKQLAKSVFRPCCVNTGWASEQSGVATNHSVVCGRNPIVWLSVYNPTDGYRSSTHIFMFVFASDIIRTIWSELDYPIYMIKFRGL